MTDQVADGGVCSDLGPLSHQTQACPPNLGLLAAVQFS